MESREDTEPTSEDREQGTPQGKLLDEESGADTVEDIEPEKEGGADSVADATGEGG